MSKANRNTAADFQQAGFEKPIVTGGKCIAPEALKFITQQTSGHKGRKHQVQHKKNVSRMQKTGLSNASQSTTCHVALQLYRTGYVCTKPKVANPAPVLFY